MKTKFFVWIIAMIILAMPVISTDTDGLIHYWSFDSDSTDDVNSWDYTVDGATHISGECVLGSGCYLFDGINDQLRYENQTLPPDEFTITAWVYENTTTTAQDMTFLHWWNDASGSGILFGYSEDGMLADNTLNWQTVASSISVDNWIFFVMTYNGTHMQYWKNNILQGTTSSFNPFYQSMTDHLYIGTHDNANGYLDGIVDEIAIYNKTLTPTELTGLWAENAGCNPIVSNCFGGGGSSGSNFTISNIDSWNSSQILSFSANINGTIYHSNSSGIIEVDFLYNNTADLDIFIYNNTDYFNRSYIGYNPNSSGSLTAYTHQAEICFNASEKVSGDYITADSFTIDSTTQNCFNISAGSQNVMAQKTGWYNQNQTFIITPLMNTTLTVQNMSYANLTIYVIDANTNQSLSGYNLTFNSLSYSWSDSASSVTNYSEYLINGTYNVTVAMPGYAVTYSQANVTVSGDTNHTFALYLANSVSITIRDEITNNPITDNVTIRWSDNTTTWENVTDTATLFVSNISAGNYTLLFYASNYSTRTYTITVGPSSHQFLTAYMISSTYSTIFTIKDIDTGNLLEDVSITMYKLINSTWTTVESKVSDISGKAQFYYDPIANYRFYLSASEYEDYVFFLNPILFSTYDVYMTKSSVLNYSVDFDDISFIYSPTTFTNNVNTSMNFLISSPNGMLTDYAIKVTYPGGTTSDSGINAIGEQLTVDLNITNATAFDYVILEFNYTTSLSGTRTYTFNLPIDMNITTGTWLSSKDKTYGMGIFERMLIATIIILFVVGIATMVGQSLPGIALGLFVYGFLVFIGFVPLWAILPSMLIGVMFLIWKSGGY